MTRPSAIHIALGGCALIAQSLLAAAPASATVYEVGTDGSFKAIDERPSIEAPSKAPAVSARLAALTATPRGGDELVRAVRDAAIRHGISPELAGAVAAQESGYDADAVSPAGAIGVMQLMPDTAAGLGVDPKDPAANIEGGVRYLKMQLARFDGDIQLALAAYNAGPERVARLGRIPRIRETQNYVASILGRLGEGAPLHVTAERAASLPPVVLNFQRGT